MSIRDLFQKPERRGKRGCKRETESRRNRRRQRICNALRFESLEDRKLLAALSANADVNVSKLAGSQSEVEIAVNPTNPLNLVVMSNQNTSADNQFIANSFDGGQTWTQRTLDDSVDGFAVDSGRFDGAVAFDAFGNMHAVYMARTSGASSIVHAISGDGGNTFTTTTLAPQVSGNDKPWIATGPDAATAGNEVVVVTYRDPAGQIVARAASVSGLGALGPFTAVAAVSDGGSNNGAVPAVGPNGEIIVTWQRSDTGEGDTPILIDRDLNGLTGGLAFGADANPFNSNSGWVDSVPPQPNRTVFASPYIEYDKSGGAFNGRLYMAYANELVDENNDHDIFLRTSDDDGATWSAARQVNTSDGATGNTEFFHNLIVDPLTGTVFIGWYDARNDAGGNTGSDTDGTANNDIEWWATASTDGGQTFLPNLRISDGSSRSSRDAGQFTLNEFGDYTGIAAYGDVVYGVWADNSDSTGDNPNGNVNKDVYVARFELVSDDPVLNADNLDNAITIRRNSGNPAELEVLIDGKLTRFNLADLNSLTINGLSGNDTLTVDSSNGLITLPDGIRFDGGLGFDRFDLRQTGSPTRTSSRVNVGALPGSGQSVIDGQTVNFENIEPVTDNVPAATFTLSSVPGIASLLDASNAINYTNAQILTSAGRITVDNFEPVEFDNKTNLVIDALAGSDEINLNNPNTPTSLASITVNGGDPTSGSDTVIISGTTGADAINFAPTTDDDAVVTGAGPVPITLAAIESAVIDGLGGLGDSLTYTSPVGRDHLVYTPGATGAGRINGFNVTLSTSLMPIAYSDIAGVLLGFGLSFVDAGGGRTDFLTIEATQNDDFIDVTASGSVSILEASGVVIVGSFDIRTAGVQQLTLHGHDGDDNFNIRAAHPFFGFFGGPGIIVNGGNPDSGSDTLNFIGSGAGAVTVDLAAKTITEMGFGPVSYSGVEHVNIDANAALIVNGTTLDDTFNVTPLADATANDGKFVHSRSAGVAFNYTDATAVTFNGGGGPDVLNILGDAAADSVTATASTITVDGSTVTLGTSLEVLNVRGLAGNDDINLSGLAYLGQLTIYGDDGDDTLTGTDFDERIEGGAGQDTIRGGTGFNELFGGADSDLLIGGVMAPLGSTNIVDGGTGTDMYYFDDMADITVDEFETTVFVSGPNSNSELTSVEMLEVNLLSAGTVTVNRLNGSDLREVFVEDESGGDATLIVNATEQPEIITIGSVPAPNIPLVTIPPGATIEQILGLHASIHTVNFNATDTIQINAGGGDDNVKADFNLTPLIVLNGEDGDDYLSGDVTINGGAGNDTLIGSPGNDTLNGGDGDDIIDGRGGMNAIDGGLGTDTILVSGTAAGETISTVHTGGTFTITGGLSAGTNTITGMEQVRIEAGDGSDIINVTTSGSGGLNYNVLGGNPIGAVGDTLNLTSASALTFMAGPEPDSGAFTEAATTNIISYDEIEDVGVTLTGPGVLTIMGTGADDDITVVGTGPNSVDVTVNDGPTISYAGVTTLTVQGKEGDDDITIDVNVANLGIAINVDGGLPTAGSDDLRITGVDGFNDMPRWTPTAVDGGVMTLLGQAPINVNFIEHLFYDGENDQENVTVVAAGTANQYFYTHTPGNDIDAGFMGLRNSAAQWLGLNYENIGSFGTITADGNNVNSASLTAFGTLGDDDVDITFTAANAIDLDLTSGLGPHVDLRSIGVQTYEVQTLDGNDDIALTGSVMARSLDVLAGSPGGSDTMTFLDNAAANDTYVVNPGANSGDGIVAVNGVNSGYIGIEHLIFLASGDVGDALTVNDDGGDNDWLVDAGPVGDRVQVDSRESVDYNNFANVNLTNSSGTDAFTVRPTSLTGFNTSLTFNGDALGVDDVLTIVGTEAADAITSGATTVTVNGVTVTVGNTNFAQLNVNALGGDDTVDLDLALDGVHKVVDLGAGNDTLDASGMLDGDFFGGIGNDTIIGSPLADRIFGGPGDDILIGGGGDDYQYGEEGNDIFGNPSLTPDGVPNDPGQDHNFGGPGFDNFIWEPGDGPDINNGGDDGADIFRFFGSAGVDAFTLRAGGTPTHFNALIGMLVIDNHGIEDVIVDGRGGADTFLVNDLFTTEVKTINLNLGAADGGALDAVTVNGRTIADNLLISSNANGAVKIEGLTYDVNLTNAELRDMLTVNGNEGNDSLHVEAGVENVITTTLNGNAGDDLLSGWFNVANGGAGNDTIIGAANSQTMDGGDGDDTFVGNGGTDVVIGGAGLIGDKILVPGTPGDDMINVTLNVAGHLLVTINGVTTTYTAAAAAAIAGAGIEKVLVEGGLGDDTLTVDSSNGAIPIPITFDGGQDFDALTLVGGMATSDIYSPGPNPGQGLSTIVIGGVTQTVSFSSLEPVIDLVGGPLVVNANDADNAISYSQSPTNAAWGRVGIDLLESIEFSNKTTLTINAWGGSDEISLNNPTTPNGLTAIKVNGGDPTAASDKVIVTGTAGVDNVTVDQLTIDGARVQGLGPIINVATAEQLVYSGLGGNDNLTVITPAGAQQVDFATGAVADRGSVLVSQGGIDSRIPIAFADLGINGSVILDDVGGTRVDTLQFTATDLDDVVNVSPTSGDIQAFNPASVGGFYRSVLVQTPGIATAILAGLDGDDVFNVPGNHPFTPTWGLDAIEIEGGNPDSGSDVLNFTHSIGGAPASVTVDLGAQTVTETGFGPVSYSSIETINANASGTDLILNATAGNDTTVVTPTSVNAGTVQNNEVSPLVNFTNVANFTVNQLGGDDVLRVHYTTNTDIIDVNVPAGSISDGVQETVNFIKANTEAVEVYGEEGNDTFNVVTDPNIPIFIDGGDPIGLSPGDTLNILAGGMGVVAEAGPESDEGGFIVGANERVSFDHIEALGVMNASKAFIVGTGADDDITIIARDNSTHAGADGVQDFTTQLNASPEIIWTNTPQLVVDARSGDDDIIMRAPAPNGANWNMTAWIFGGAPAAGPGDEGDRFELETPHNTPDNILYTPTAIDSGILVIDEAGTGAYVPATDTIIQLGNVPPMPPMPGFPNPDPGGIETLVYDGEGGNDRLTIIGDAAMIAGTVNDIFTHTPGTAPDDGTVLVNSLLAIQYTDLGATGTVTADGRGGTDTLNVVGTAQNDVINVVATTGTIEHTLSNGAVRVPIAQTNIEGLVIDALAGDDAITINEPQPYQSIGVNGGQPDAGSDTLALIGAAVAVETVTIAPAGPGGTNQLVTGLSAPIAVTGTELISYTGVGGDDNLNVNVDNFVTEARVDSNNAVAGGTDRVTSNGLPKIDFSGVNNFTLLGGLHKTVMTFAPSFLSGSSNYFAALGQVDTLVIEGINSLNDNFTVSDRDGAGGNLFEVADNTSPGSVVVTATGTLAFQDLRLNTLGGDDTVTVNTANTVTGDVISTPITFDGGAGSDVLQITGSPAVTIINTATYSPGADVTEGRLTYDTDANAANGVAMQIDFVNLEPVHDNVVAGNLVVNGTNADNAINYSAGLGGGIFVGNTGLVSVDGFETIEFNNKTNLIVNGLSGSDEFSLNNPATPNGLASITVNGGDPTAGSDVAIISGTTGADTINFAPTTDDDAVVTGAGPVPITLTTIESTVIDGQSGADTLTYTSPAGLDVLTMQPGADFTSGSIAGQQAFAPLSPLMPLSYTHIANPAAGALTFADAGAIRGDFLSVVGTEKDDNFTVNPAGNVTLRALTGVQTALDMATPGIDQLTLQGLNGSDTFNVAGNHPFPNATGFPQGGIVVEGGNPDSGSDVLNVLGGGAAITAVLPTSTTLGTISEMGFTAIAYSGIETSNINAAAANLTFIGTPDDDHYDVTPKGPSNGTLTANSVAPTFNYNTVGTLTVDGGTGSVGDVVNVNGSSNHDVITVDSPTRTVTVTNAAGTLLEPVVLANNIETARVSAGLGNDTIVVVPAPAIANGPGGAAPPTQVPINLMIDVDGGPPNASDALVIAADVNGATLPASDFVVHNKGRDPDTGRLRVFRNATAMPDISYTNVEIISPLVAGGAINPQLLTVGPDLYEENETFPNAAFIGTGETINVTNLAIFPDAREHRFVPADNDFFRVVAKETGTLDIVAYFRTFDPALLPGGGDIQLQVHDVDGTLIAGNGSFGNLDGTPNARVRIPAVAGQTYYIHVFGNTANVDLNGLNSVTNGYDLTITNTAPAVPYDLELVDIVGISTVAAAPAPTLTSFAAAANPSLSAVNDFYNGKYVYFTSGPQAGNRATITDYVGATRTFTLTGLNGASPTAGDSIVVETHDTGRSQLDNITRDDTPVIRFRLDDDLLLHDLPGNPTPNTPPDEVIAIPFNAAQTATSNSAGYRVPVFIEGPPQHAGGQLPQVPVGYARMIFPGVYEFDFGKDAAPGNTPFPLTPSDGSYFISAKVQIIDPSTNPVNANHGFGARSGSLEIVVDTLGPPVYFGSATVVGDGLHPDSDSGVQGGGNSITLNDNITNDLTPTFWGVAEANSLLRVYLDLNDNGMVDIGTDIAIATTTALPLDGTNQLPNGNWQATSQLNMNDPQVVAALGFDGLRTILVTAEDVAGNENPAPGQPHLVQKLDIFIDTQGPQVFDPDGQAGGRHAIEIVGNNGYDLFDLKPNGIDQGPTPRVDQLRVNIRDLPNRVLAFAYAALQAVNPAEALGHISVVGDHSGRVAITNVQFSSIDIDGPGPATGEIILTFAESLPDDRFTLTISDELRDPAGNRLDGESNAAEPNESPTFPSGDGQPGGDFVARFTVDSRPEIATWSQGVVYADINGNFVWDPEGQDNDATNRDFVYNFGEQSEGLLSLTDAFFVGNFAARGESASGFDKLAIYGRQNGVYRFVLDTDDDGVSDTVGSMAYQVNAIPVAGDFDPSSPGDEIGAYDGQYFYLDIDHSNSIDHGERFATSLRGIPFVGDFDGDGSDDIATFNNDSGVIQFDLDGNLNTVEDTLKINFGGFGEKPMAGDFNLDGVDDIVMWVPHQAGQVPVEAGEFHFFISDAPYGYPSDNFNNGEFRPSPLGNDLFAQFGDQFALPLFGNFDPPSSGAASGDSPSGEFSPLDTNMDGSITALDALVVINALAKNELSQSGELSSATASADGYRLDASGDGKVTALDALMVINQLAKQSLVEGELVPSQPASDWSAAADQAIADFDSDDEDELLRLLADDQELF